MVTHTEACEECRGGDSDILAATYDESLPPQELADYIASTHSPEWTAFMERHGR
ncbi:hypothetical protein HS041_28840 [Planomonospora sp. ID67723]|uniref:hypothetical protein n=1 Tax=Planomonospora sp. ID67723 TaxID=2738134 RepID=UPI0018C3E900|nr:hypothetical protein [Planomonospora sp. ID67723]MBG0831733.1 hypothetical protein [Planomonospora sp. ID67723]